MIGGGVLLWRDRSTRPFAIVASVMLASHLTFHSFYGDETFLYALHFVPLLLVHAGGLFVRPNRWALPLLAAFTLAVAANNATELARTLETPTPPDADPRFERLGPLEPADPGASPASPRELGRR